MKQWVLVMAYKEKKIKGFDFGEESIRRVCLSPFIGKPGCNTKLGSVKIHPNMARFLRKFPTVEAWCNAHPGCDAGRLLPDSSEGKPTYYSYILKHTQQRKFNWSFNQSEVSFMRSDSTFCEYGSFSEMMTSLNEIVEENT